MDRRCEQRGMRYEPESVDFHEADDIFFKRYELPVNALVPQHVHDYDHTTILATGALRVWCDEVLVGDVKAPVEMLIKANTKHTFLALEPSLLYCVHNLRGKTYRISEEHVLWH